MPTKPQLTVYVVSDHATVLDSVGAGFSGLVDTVETERHTFNFRRDVHRDNGSACAVLVVHDVHGIDEAARLFALHARREGVEVFILVLRLSPGYGPPEDHPLGDAVERDARAMFTALGIDGDSVRVVRSPRDLRAALDDLPPVLPPPAPLAVTPPEFAREAALLAVVRPLLVPSTALKYIHESYAHDPGWSGSTGDGMPYLAPDAPWPGCRGCGRPMGCVLQIDSRDALHAAPPGRYVVFTCDRDECPSAVVAEVHHHIDPDAAPRRLVAPANMPGWWDAESWHLRPLGLECQLPESTWLIDEHPLVAERLIAITGEDDPIRVYERVAAAMGATRRSGHPHLGGHPHHYGNELSADPVTPPLCGQCGAPRTLVVEIEWFRYIRNLWACREHPADHSFVSRPVLVEEDFDDPFF